MADERASLAALLPAIALWPTRETLRVAHESSMVATDWSGGGQTSTFYSFDLRCRLGIVAVAVAVAVFVLRAAPTAL